MVGEWRSYWVTLRPQGAFRFGAHAGDMARSLPTAQSDSLFGAIVDGINATAGQERVEETIRAFEAGRPPWLIGGLQPALGDAVFWPLPRRRPRWTQTHDGRESKRTKNARWVTVAGLRAWLSEGEWEPEVAAGGEVVGISGERIPDRPLYRVASRTQIVVNRENQSATPFPIGGVVYDEEVALRMLVAVPSSWPNELDRALEYLAWAGIGGERSTGHGRFGLEGRIEASLSVGAGRRGSYLASLLWPTGEDLNAGVLSVDSSYSVGIRQGRISSPSWRGYRTRPVAMIEAGAVFGTPIADIPGRLGDVSPIGFDVKKGDHKVYRYGFGLLLPVEGI